MGRTMLYILIGVSVVGALAVLLLISPMTNTPEQVDVSEVTSGDISLSEPSESTTLPEIQAEETSGEVTDPVRPPLEEAISTLATTVSIDGTIVDGEYAHEMTVAGVDVYWTNDDAHLYMGLVSPGTGYVSIGFDPDRQMEGANFIIGSMHEGELTIRDDIGHEPLAHMEDTARGGEDNILAAAGNEWPDQTVIEFIIPLDSGDSMDKPLRPGHQYTVLLAYHSLLDSLSGRHTRRGSGLLQLDLPDQP